MAAKSKSDPGGRRREIAGVCLLGFGIFCVVSLISMQSGANRVMGPGGAAAAAALYALAGLGAYLLVGAVLVIATRAFRGRPLVHGAGEVLTALGLLGSGTVLLHLPFSDGPVTLNGPGGLLGQWLGEIIASFIGNVGAALAAATVLFACVLTMTNMSTREVAAAIGWAGTQVGRGLLAGARALGRVVVAMFPERDDTARARDDREEAYDDEPAGEDERREVAARAAAVPVSPMERGDSEAVIVGAARGMHEDLDADADEAPAVPEPVRRPSPAEEERRAMAALIAEVAAVECAAPPAPVLALPEPLVREPVASEPPVIEEEPTLETAPPLPAKPEEAPVIVDSPFLARQRKKAAEAAAAAAASSKEDGPGFIQLSGGVFQLPGTEMLEYQPPQNTDTDKQQLYEMAARLEQALATFNARGKVREIQRGPVVTMFEVLPAPGVRAARYLQLENDLAMALEAQAVRIVAPVPGKPVVGVEVPNKIRETVYLKEILEDDSFARADSKLQISLGKDTKGAPISVNLAKMPHLLVAGTTGSGKSVAVNSMITSILFRATPEEVRFIMVDPKMLELSIYEGIPHLLLPVVTDPKKANLALRWAVEEMERRYELLAKTGVRDISSYNAKVEADRARRDGAVKAALEESDSKRARRLKVVIAGEDGVEREVEVDAEAEAASPSDLVIPAAELAEEESSRRAAAQHAAENAEPAPRKLPYIVIVIDEFADLMMVAPKDVETSVARIAQKARAAGLHLILATQRPSVDVITGLIKANFPSRIALQVASRIDARTILDQPGAETLLGNGDMLFSDRGTKVRRIHGSFLSDDEVHRVVEFMKTQAKPVYDMDILKPRDEEGEDGAAPQNDFHDELYDKAVAIVCETRQASVSFIQRRLGIGYNRSARMVEQMERDGIVGPANGIKPREVLAPPGEYLTNAS